MVRSPFPTGFRCMTEHELRPTIDALWERRETLSPTTHGSDRAAVEAALDALDDGTLRVAEPGSGGWVVHDWLEKGCAAVVSAER